MILSRYCIIYDKFFTEHECDIIEKVASSIQLEEGLIGNIEDDPDAERQSGTNDNFIRQSDVKWIEHHIMPNEIQDKMRAGINQAQIVGNCNDHLDHVV